MHICRVTVAESVGADGGLPLQDWVRLAWRKGSHASCAATSADSY